MLQYFFKIELIAKLIDFVNTFVCSKFHVNGRLP